MAIQKRNSNPLPDTGGLPFSLEAEKAILGSSLLDHNAYLQAAPNLRPDDFFSSSNRRIYEAFLALDGESRPLDLISLTEQLESTGGVGAVGGVAYLSDLTTGLPHRPNIEHYVKLVKDKSMLRALFHVAQGAASAALLAQDDPSELVASVSGRLLDILANTRKIEVHHVKDFADAMFDQMVEVARQPKLGVRGLRFGVRDLDEMTGGMLPGENIVIAGYSSDGKSLTCQQVVYENCVEGVPALVFTQEMTKEQYVRRMIPQATDGFFPAKYLRDYRGLDASDIATLREAQKKLAQLPLWVVDASSVTTREMLAVARAAVRRHKIQLFVMDYIQLIRPDGEDSDYQRVTYASEGIRQLAKDEGIVTIQVSQLTWTKEKKKTPPTMGQLRSSGDLANGAHIIVFPFRPENENGYMSGEDQLRIGKMREGGRKPIPVTLDTTLLKYVTREVVKTEPKAKKTEPEKKAETKAKKAAATSGPDQQSF